MPITTVRFEAAGVTNVRYGLLNSDGILIGSEEVLVAGDQDGSSMARFYGMQEVPIGNPDAEVVSVPGDDTTLAQFIFDSTELPQGTLSTGTRDFELEELATGLIIQNDLGGQGLAGGAPKGVNLRDMCLIVQGRAADADDGTSRWEVMIISICQIKPLDRESFATRADATYRYQVITQRSNAYPWGETLSVSTHGTCKAVYHSYILEYPINTQAWRADGVETVFNFAIEPVSATEVIVAIDGAVQAGGWTIDTAAKTITFVSAPGNNSIINVTHQMDEVC